jgi:pimeloyl-ACP methyl ester carboxylesterase
MIAILPAMRHHARMAERPHLARHVTGGEPVLLLLHGLGATGEVWQGLLERNWPGEVLAPDLPGHGRSPELPEYTFESMTAAVATLLTPGRQVVVLGHSLGGVLGLELASGAYGIDVTSVCAVGIKLRWSEEELSRAAALAAKPARVFATRDEAVDRWLKVSGLAGLVAPDSPRVAAGVAETDGGWRVRVDQRAFGVGAPNVPALLDAAKARTMLTAGEHDQMCPPEHLHEVMPDAVVLPGVGHNVHVENPLILWPILDRLLASATAHLGQ